MGNMKVYGNVTLSEGSDFKNLTIATGPNFPDDGNLGELFYHTSHGLCVHDGSSWKCVVFDDDQRLSGLSISKHGDLTGLLENDHPQYLTKDGSTILTGNLDFGLNNIVNVNFINGVNFLSHGSRHGANGADAIPTAAPLSPLNKSSVNSAGNANTLSRSDHSHEIQGFQPESTSLSNITNLTGSLGLLRKTGENTWSLDTAVYLTSNQNITVSGDASGSGSTSITLTLSNSGVVAGTYNNVATQVRPFTVDSKGRVTSIGNAVTITPAWGSVTSKPADLTAIAALAGTSGFLKKVSAGVWTLDTNTYLTEVPNIDWSKITSGKPTTLDGYGITDGLSVSPNSGQVIKTSFYSVPIMSGSSILSFNGNVPSIAEGTLLTTIAITPSSVSSKIGFRASIIVDTNHNDRNVVLALFRGNVCVYSVSVNVIISGRPNNLTFDFVDSPNTVSLINYTIRCGTASSTTWYINQLKNGTSNGGTTASTFTVTEYS